MLLLFFSCPLTGLKARHRCRSTTLKLQPLGIAREISINPGRGLRQGPPKAGAPGPPRQGPQGPPRQGPSRQGPPNKASQEGATPSRASQTGASRASQSGPSRQGLARQENCWAACLDRLWVPLVHEKRPRLEVGLLWEGP